MGYLGLVETHRESIPLDGKHKVSVQPTLSDPTLGHAVHHKAADHHRKAAHHFEAAAKHQLAAAEADDHDDVVKTAHHAYLAYGHQIQAIHYAEMAAKEDESVDHADVDHGDEDHVKDLHE